MKTTVTHVGIAVFVVFSVLVSSSWAAKFTDKDVSGNRQNGTLKRQHNWEIKTSNGLKIPEGWEPFGSMMVLSGNVYKIPLVNFHPDTSTDVLPRL